MGDLELFGFVKDSASTSSAITLLEMHRAAGHRQCHPPQGDTLAAAGWKDACSSNQTRAIACCSVSNAGKTHGPRVWLHKPTVCVSDSVIWLALIHDHKVIHSKQISSYFHCQRLKYSAVVFIRAHQVQTVYASKLSMCVVFCICIIA